MSQRSRALRTVLLLSVALAWTALLARPALAGIDRWTAFGPGAGSIQTLLAGPAPSAALYVLTRPGYSDFAGSEIYKSADEGTSWTGSGTGLPILHHAEPQALALDPGRPGTLYTARGRLVFRSDDGAGHWQAAGATGLPDDLHETCLLAVAAGGPSAIFLAYGPRLVRSTDAGGSWSPVLEAAADIRTLFVQPSAPHTLYVGTAGDGGNLVSTDGGETFHPMSGLGEITAFAAPISGPPGLLYAASAGMIYSSEDSGLLWRQRGQIGRPVNALAVGAGSAMVLYAAHDHGLSVSRDGGETWRASPAGFPQQYSAGDDGLVYPEQVLALAVDPARPGRVYAGADDSGVYSSSDSGRQWTSGAQRGLLSGVAHFLKIHPKVPRVMYLGKRDSVDILWRTTDGGQTWTRRSDISRGFNIIELALNPFDANVVYAVGSGLFRSLDGGVTWSRVGTSPFRSVVVTGRRTLVALADSGIVRTADGGIHWEPVFRGSSGAADRSYGELRGDPGDLKTVYALVYEGPGDPRTEVLFRSKDGGATWSRFFTGSSIAASASSRPRTIYTAVGTTLLRTTNDGRRWDAVGPTPQAAFNSTLVVDPRDPLTLLVGTVDQGVLRSTDGGKTWDQVDAGLAELGRTLVTQVTADPSAPHTFYALPLAGGLFKVKFVD